MDEEKGSVDNKINSKKWPLWKVIIIVVAVTFVVGAVLALAGFCGYIAYKVVTNNVTPPFCDVQLLEKMQEESENTDFKIPEEDPYYKKLIKQPCGDRNALFVAAFIVNGTIQCGAAFFTRDILILAAHCFNQNVESSQLVIKNCAGDHCETIFLSRNQFRIIVPEKYIWEYSAHDVAYIQVKVQIDIIPTCIPTSAPKDAENYLLISHENKSNPNAKLNFMAMTGFPSEYCSKQFTDLCKLFSNLTFCAGSTLENGTIIGANPGEFL